MMKVLIKYLALPVLLLAGSITLNAQGLTYEYGEITDSDYKLKSVGFLKDADAVVIYDIGESDFFRADYNFYINFERKTRIKIFSKAGIENATIVIPFYKGDDFTEKVSGIKGVTYNLEDGSVKKTKLDKSQIFEEKVNENWYIKKFTMPAVKEGSVIEFSYDHDTPYKANLQDWEFQREIPTLYSEYTVHLTPFYNYIFLLQGDDHFDKHDSWVEDGLPRKMGTIEYKMQTHRFVKKSIPAFEDESFITSKNDYIIKLDFQLTSIIRADGSKIEYLTTWEDFIKDLLKSEEFGKYQKTLERKSKSFVKENQLLDYPPMERFQLIVNHVKNDYVWDHYKRLFAKKSASDFLKSKSGNCSEINLYLAALLNAAGLEAYPLILSTRDHGKIKIDYPFWRFFNYVVVAARINDRWILTDGTAIQLKNDKIPSMCFNDNGLLIRDQAVEWINLTDTETSSLYTNLKITCHEKFDSLSANISLISHLYVAEKLKLQYTDNLEKIKKNFEENGYQAVEIKETRNFEEPEKPYIIIGDVQKSIDMIDGKYLVQPFLSEVADENPFKGNDRKYPIDMTFPVQHKYFSEITIPEGYQLTGHPSNKKTDNEFIALEYNVETRDNMVTVTGYYEFKKAVYDASKFADLKAFFNLVIKQFNEALVFEKTVPDGSTGDRGR